jgi:hypothetical protein
MDEFRLYLSNLAALLLQRGFGQASLLTGTKPFDIFLVTNHCSLVFPIFTFLLGIGGTVL